MAKRPAEGRKPPKPRAKGHGAKSEAVREQAILALLSEKTLEKAASRAGVAVLTLRRWMSDDEAFKAEYHAARRAVYEAGISRVNALVGKAVDTLDDLMNCTNPAVQLGASRAIVDVGMYQQDASAIMQKLDEIEARQGAKR